MNTVKIENTEFVRDMGTKAVLNTDAPGLARYKETRRKALQNRRETVDTKRRLETIELEMARLKKIISDLTAMRQKG